MDPTYYPLLPPAVFALIGLLFAIYIMYFDWLESRNKGKRKS